MDYWVRYQNPDAPRQIMGKVAKAAHQYRLKLPLANNALYRAAVSYTGLSIWERWRLRRAYIAQLTTMVAE
ncbi:hypothetical protein [Loigolactobacillus jiayinensis]|uniref:Uncharacterized protein n=1 Tax=Loigolactobacillus jiayinensis TaxID=2486016 RepID=A0ABW1RE02_9LACO|nr:hypothetical protein [Loigolactobacillus jiayinensis]